MTNAHEDRHVLAAAVASGAQAIVTSNLRDFPKAACQPFGIEILHPDQFLCDLHGCNAARVHAALRDQVAALSRPPMNVRELLELLEKSTPQFAKRIRDDLPSD